MEKCLKRPNIAKSFQQLAVDKLWKNVENFGLSKFSVESCGEIVDKMWKTC